MQVGGVGSGHDTYSHHVTSCLHEHGANTDTAVWGLSPEPRRRRRWAYRSLQENSRETVVLGTEYWE